MTKDKKNLITTKIVFATIFTFCFISNVLATNFNTGPGIYTYPDLSQVTPNYGLNYNFYNNPYNNSYNNPNYDNGYNSSYYPGYYPYYNYGNSAYMIPMDTQYYISGYNLPPYAMSNGEPMVTRLPIFASNYTYPAYIANGLIDSAYRSITNWCDQNIYTGNVENYFLNHASIERMTPYEIVLIVNCSLAKKGLINGYVEFRVTLNIAGNSFKWRKLSNNNDSDIRVYEYDSDTGEIIIIR